MHINRIQGELGGRPQIDDFSAGRREFPAHCFVLSLRGREIGNMQKAQLLPMSRLLRLIPAGIPRRAHHHPLQHSDHRMSVEAG